MTLPEFSVFVKPWKDLPLPQLAARIKGLGFDGIELPIRPGFPVNLENVAKALPDAARIFGDQGLKIHSVAADLTEPVFSAAAEAGVPIVRVCVGIPAGQSYLATEAAVRKEYLALVPLLNKYGVTIGLQNHCDRWIPNALGLRHLIEDFDPKNVAAVWDAAHAALNGEDPELGLDIVWSHLRMVNLKNAYWKRTSAPETEVASWKITWTSGRQGLASWAEVARILAERKYQGPVCLTAEYSSDADLERLIAEDIRFARELFAKAYANL